MKMFAFHLLWPRLIGSETLAKLSDIINVRYAENIRSNGGWSGQWTSFRHINKTPLFVNVTFYSDDCFEIKMIH